MHFNLLIWHFMFISNVYVVYKCLHYFVHNSNTTKCKILKKSMLKNKCIFQSVISFDQFSVQSVFNILCKYEVYFNHSTCLFNLVWLQLLAWYCTPTTSSNKIWAHSCPVTQIMSQSAQRSSQMMNTRGGPSAA